MMATMKRLNVEYVDPNPDGKSRECARCSAICTGVITAVARDENDAEERREAYYVCMDCAVGALTAVVKAANS